MNTFAAGFWIFTQRARGSRRHASGSAITDETTFVEQFDKGMLAMAGNRARVTNGSGGVWVIGLFGDRIASQTGEKALSECSEIMGTRVEGLYIDHC